jgi:diketogulonate reductase-like aldo/keto reductase
LPTPTIPLINGIPALGLGTYPLSGATCIDTIRMAIGLGYRHIDTAQMYGNEREVGEAIAACGVARDQLFITTKVDPSNLGQARFAESVKRSVAALGGAPDLLLIHWPPPDAEIDAALDLLAAELQAGRTRRIGVSNFTPRMLRQAVKRLGPVIACNQVEFHPLLDQTVLKATADELGLPLVAYSPIARGKTFAIPAVQAAAARHGCSANEVVLRWIIQQGVVAIPKTDKRAHAESNLRALSLELSADEMSAIAASATRGGRTINGSWMAGRWDD